MEKFKLLVDTVKKAEPYIIKMSESEYQKRKAETLKDAADTGNLNVYNFMVEVFELLDNKRVLKQNG